MKRQNGELVILTEKNQAVKTCFDLLARRHSLEVRRQTI
jgi:hypothetical protein